MGNPFGTAFVKHNEHDVQLVMGFIAIDSSSNVIGMCPTAAAPGAGPYSLCKGVTKSIGVAGAVITQPHQGVGTGTYVFTLDEPWGCLLYANATLIDPSAANPAETQVVPIQGYAPLNPYFRANVRNSTNNNNTMRNLGVDPGTDPNLTAQTVTCYWRVASDGNGTLADPPPNSGWWMLLLLKRTAIY